jgi:O-antigen/teichoic acid export membrane protein
VASLRRDASLNAFSNLVLAVLGTASGSLISYRYGVEGRGVIGAAQVVAALTAGLGALGLGDALLYAIASGRRVTLSVLVRATVGAALVAALFGSIAGWIVSRRIDVGPHPSTFVWFCAVVASATGCLVVPSGALRGIGDWLTWNLVRALAVVGWIIALLVGGSSGSYHLERIAFVYAAILVGLTLLAIVRCRIGLVRTPERQTLDSSMRFLLAFGLPSSLALAPLMLNARIDQVALSLVKPADIVGQYVAAAGYCWATVPLGQAIANLTATRVAAQPDPVLRVAILRQLTRIGVTVIGISGVVAWIAAPVALRILNGPGFGGAVGISRILIIGTSLQGVTFLLEEGARGLGRPRLAMRAELLGLLAMLALLLILTRYGALPTAVASAAGYVVSFVVIGRSVAQHSEVSMWDLVRPASIRRAIDLRRRA